MVVSITLYDSRIHNSHWKIQLELDIPKLSSHLSNKMVELGIGPAKMRGERPQPKRLEKISNNTDSILTNGCLYRIYKR
jgi:hypothetical protein